MRSRISGWCNQTLKDDFISNRLQQFDDWEVKICIDPSFFVT
jgi:hypothetical protein